MPNSGYFDTVFAASGDTAVVPDAAQPSGAVSYTQGFSAPYSLAPSNPSALLVPRTSFNQIIKDITTAIQNWQQNAFPPFITTAMNNGSPYPYGQYVVVNRGGTLYQSLIANNTDTPPTSNWAVFTGGAGGSTGFSTGDAKLTWKTSPDSGWILMVDGTIGSASSGATFADPTASALYQLWWNNISNTYCPVTGGRGVSASADFLANKPMGMPIVLSRAMAIAGTGAGLSTRALGQYVGDENLQSHTHTVNDPTHTHSITAPNLQGGGTSVAGGSGYSSPAAVISAASTGISINAAGSGSGGNMQPTSFMNLMVKL